MPTYYTNLIQKGISFEDFVMACTRNFGATLDMKDSPNDAKLPEEFEYDDMYLKDCYNSIRKFQRLLKLSYKECDERAKKEHMSNVKRLYERIKRLSKIKKQYLAMLDKVKNWNPPTEDHISLKDFMIEQIEGSIKFDCNIESTKEDLNKPMLTGKEWKETKLKHIAQHIIFESEHMKKELHRVTSCNRWLQQVRDSLK